MSKFNETQTLILHYNENNHYWQDVTSQVEELLYETNAYRVKYVSGPTFYYTSRQKLKIYQSPEGIDLSNYAVYYNGTALTDVMHVLWFDDWYKVFYRSGKSALYPVSDIKFQKDLHKELSIKNLLDYLTEIARYISVEEGQNFLSKQLETLFVSQDSALAKLIQKSITTNKYNGVLIFPFSTNASQQKAVKIAMEEDISLIQGPPGTGKTQTILNIIANAIFQGKSVAVVSGNNEATRNVYEKFKKEGYEYLNAFLGNSDNVNAFFEKAQVAPPADMVANRKAANTLIQRSAIVRNAYQKKLRVSEILQQINELETEKAINDAEYAIKDHTIPKDILKKHYTSRQLLELSARLQCVSDEKYMAFFNRVRLLFRYGIIYTRKKHKDKYDIIEYLENQYYVEKIFELGCEKDNINAYLRENNVEDVVRDYTKCSKELFNASIAQRYRNVSDTFTKANYKFRFEEFVKRYPVVYSTTHSLSSCSGSGYLYDYVIIDESSQVDLVTAAIAFSCAKKVVLVGDEKQLPHVVKSSHIRKLNELFDASGLDGCYNYVSNNIMSCVKAIFPNVKSTLLREHYRCDPEIIGFCNKRFYNNELVVIKEHEEGCGVEIISHPSHVANGRTNEREVEIIARELLPNIDGSNIGIVAPYRAQVDLLQAKFKQSNMQIDTVHKFQGKECQSIILSSVANKVRFYEDDEKIDFLNNPNLINVAISRAIKKLYVLASQELLSQEGSLLRDMSKYCEYYCSETKVTESNVYSVFDLMYDDYAPILEEMKQRLLKISEYQSENIIATVIQDICQSGKYGGLAYKFNYPLRAVIKVSTLSDREDVKFVCNVNTHCDFVIYSTLDKSIQLVVEVDGKQHQEEVQARRDRRKDRLLNEAGINVLRLPTTSMDCKEKIIDALRVNNDVY